MASGCATNSAARVTAPWCWCTKWLARSKVLTTSCHGSRKRAGCCATTPEARECPRRCAASLASIRWPTTSQACSMRSASPARSHWRVSPSAAQSHFISRPDTPSAPARSRSAVRPPASQRSVARQRLNGSSRSRPPAWLSPSPIRCRMVMRRSFAATSRALNDTGRGGSATIPRAMPRSGACWPASTCRTN